MLRSLISGSFTGLCLIASLSPTFAEEPAERTARLVKTFIEEFVPVTPGQGRYWASPSIGTEKPGPSELPLTKIKMSVPFSMAKHEVPQNLYEAVMGRNPSRWKGPRNSVEMVSFADAEAFCEEVTQLARDAKLISDKMVIQLPSEAEWEYCCRAGTTTAYSFGEEAQAATDVGVKATLLNHYGWHTGNAAGNDPAVGALKPNPWGFYDMHGYLWEFTRDGWSTEVADIPRDGSPNPRRPGNDRIVLRGGSWKDDFRLCRSSSRKPFAIDAVDDAVGFRCVLSQTVKAP